MVGDLALLGIDLHGFVVAHRSGHQTNAALARRLLEQVAGRRRRRRSSRCPLREDGTIDIAGIMSLLPHRYPFLLVDRVLELDPGRRVVGIKNVSVNEPFFQGHWPGQADHAGRADRRGPGAGRRRPDRRERRRGPDDSP